MDIAARLNRRQFLKDSFILLGGISLYGCDNVPSETPAPGAIAPAISLEPADTSVLIGHPATFQVATDGTLPLAFQWQRDGQDIPGATGLSYTLVPTSISEDGSNFSVNITNQAGSANSRIAILNVTSTGSTVDTTSIRIDTTSITIDEI